MIPVWVALAGGFFVALIIDVFALIWTWALGNIRFLPWKVVVALGLTFAFIIWVFTDD